MAHAPISSIGSLDIATGMGCNLAADQIALAETHALTASTHDNAFFAFFLIYASYLSDDKQCLSGKTSDRRRAGFLSQLTGRLPISASLRIRPKALSEPRAGLIEFDSP
jgi:hypothetical protein